METKEKTKKDENKDQSTSKNDQKSKNKLKKWKKRMKNQPQNITLEKEDQSDYFKDLLPEKERNETEIPRAITVFNYINACEKEVSSMLTAIKSHSGSKTALQVLPRHLRRRAASHNIKRLPRRLRNLAKQQNNEQNEKKDQSDVCRKKRRRKLNLQNEYAKRNGKQGWLETHMWHAKRFHMSDSTDPQYSGFDSRVPLFPNDKSFRSCYRAVTKHCLIQDISYLKCLQMIGQQTDVCQLICDITLHSEQHNILSPEVLEGKLETKILIFEKNKNVCVGPATLMFKATEKDKTLVAWLWFNPLLNKEINELLEENIKENNIEIRDISDSLVRFRLTGPKSSVTMLSVLKPFITDQIVETDNSDIKTWLNKNKDQHEKQILKFNSIMKVEHERCFSQVVGNNPQTQPQDGAILSLIVNDPRLTLPLQKTLPTFKETTDDMVINTEVNDIIDASTYSLLWDTSVRDQVAESRLPDHIVSTRRNENKFSADKKVLTQIATSVPVIVVRRSGFKNAKEISSVHSGPPTHFASGWDLIIPHKWATGFWVPFIYHRSHAGGIRETERCHLECKAYNFPQDYPNTKVGQDWWNKEKDKNVKTYYRKPPAKRPNYSVLGSPFPFAPDWKYLFKTFNTGLNGEQNVVTSFNENDNTTTNEIQLKCENGSNSDQIKKTKISATTAQENTLKFSLNEVEENKNIEKDSAKIKEADVISNIQVQQLEESKTLDVKVSGNILLTTNNFNKNDENNLLKRTLDSNNQEDLPSKKLKSDKDIENKEMEIKVLRDLDKLEMLKQLLQGKLTDPHQLVFQNNTIIGVTVTPLNKGAPTPQTMICSPSYDDIVTLEREFKDPYGKGLANCQGPVEPKHWDPFRKERKLAKSEAKIKAKSKNVTQKNPVLKPSDFKVFPSRKIIGFVTSGDFLFSYASGGGIGFISFNHFLNLIKIQRENIWLKEFLAEHVKNEGIIALIRPPNTSQYRYVVLNIAS